jgi:hypothetical protein
VNPTVPPQIPADSRAADLPEAAALDSVDIGYRRLHREGRTGRGAADGGNAGLRGRGRARGEDG